MCHEGQYLVNQLLFELSNAHLQYGAVVRGSVTSSTAKGALSLKGRGLHTHLVVTV